MNLAMHCVYFPPEVGGLESHVYYLCRGLVERGCTVSIVTSRSREGLPGHESMDGIEVWRTWLPGRNPMGWLLHGIGSTPRLGRVAFRADVVHAQAFQSIPSAWLAKSIGNIPLVSTWHTSHFLKRAESPFWAPVFKRMLRASDWNLAASVEISEVAENVAPGVKVEPLTNGVETDLFRRVERILPDSERRRIVVPRRLVHKNGVEFLVKAMPLIAEKVDAEAVIVGDGPERSSLEVLAGKLGVSDRIRFLGSHLHSDMPGLLSSAELAVFPSLMEATSVAALECMACELPVAASDVGGLPELIDDEVGGLFEAGSAASLARVVASLLRRDDLPTLGARARARVVANWSNARLVDRHLEVYKSLVEGRRRAVGSPPS